jgi:hypothetical protein
MAGERRIGQEWKSHRCKIPVEKGELVSMQATLDKDWIWLLEHDVLNNN